MTSIRLGIQPAALAADVTHSAQGVRCAPTRPLESWSADVRLAAPGWSRSLISKGLGGHWEGECGASFVY
jgi:hypothetical protein